MMISTYILFKDLFYFSQMLFGWRKDFLHPCKKIRISKGSGIIYKPTKLIVAAVGFRQAGSVLQLSLLAHASSCISSSPCISSSWVCKSSSWAGSSSLPSYISSSFSLIFIIKPSAASNSMSVSTYVDICPADSIKHLKTECKSVRWMIHSPVGLLSCFLTPQTVKLSLIIVEFVSCHILLSHSRHFK